MKNKPKATFRISHFISEEAYGGIILIFVTIAALIWANSAYYDSYHYLWHELKVGFVWGEINMVGSLHHWINDGLMALFFFVIGLEIKREIMGGELSSLKKASLPIAAAIGGMLIPAAVYALVLANHPEYLDGWGIPMATDIAFALGLLALLGKRVNINLKIFLTALAIADDLGGDLSRAKREADECLAMCDELRARAEEIYGLLAYLCVEHPEQQRLLAEEIRRKKQIDRESGTRNLALDRELAEEKITLREERASAIRRLKQLGAPYSKSKCGTLE